MSYKSARPGKPVILTRHGRWVVTGVPSFPILTEAAEKWADRRNYFIGVKASVKLGQALDCTARGCPVPKDDDEAQAIGNKHAEWKAGKPAQPPSARVEVGHGPFN